MTNAERIKQLAGVYGSAKREIEAELRKASLTSFKRFALEEHLAQVKTIVAALDAEAAEAAGAMIPARFWGQAGLTRSVLAKVDGGRKLPDRWLQIAKDQVDAFANQMTLDLVQANGSLERNASRILRLTQQSLIEERQLNEMLARGAIQGKTMRDRAAELRDALEKRLPEGSRVTAGKLTFEPDYYAEMVARTRTSEAAVQGSLTVAREWGVTLMRWSVHEGACPVCERYQGRVYSLVPGSRFPELTGETTPPVHPHCGHSLEPFVEEGYSEDELAAYERVSKAEGVIVGTSDFKRVLGGGKLRNAYSGVVPGSLNRADERALALIGGAPVEPGDIELLRERAAGAEFEGREMEVGEYAIGIEVEGTPVGAKEPSLRKHVAQRIAQKNWPAGTTTGEYLDDLRACIMNESAGIGVYEHRGLKNVCFMVSAGDVIPASRDTGKGKNLLVLYSPELGVVSTGYRLDRTRSLEKRAKWLQKPKTD